jgi:hypothetical protein
MEEQERYLGGVTSPYLVKGFKGCEVHVTTRRIIGVRRVLLPRAQILGTYVPGPKNPWFLNVLSNPTQEEFDKAFNELLKTKDFEFKKEEVERIRLKRPGRLSSGHINFVLKSGEEIKVTMEAYPAYRKLFEIVGELMQAFLPEAVELEN